jgi:exonuclease III
MSDYLSLLVWNVRGLNYPARCDAIYQLVLLSGASVVCFQETKLQLVTLAVVDRCCGRDFDSFFFFPAAGTSGGILLAWKSSTVSFSNPHLSTNAVTARAEVAGSAGLWFMGVCGPQAKVDNVSSSRS